MHTALHIFFRLSVFVFFVGRVQSLLLLTGSSTQGGTLHFQVRSFFALKFLLGSVRNKQKPPWIHKSKRPFESKGNSACFLEIFSLGKAESQRIWSIPKRVKKELPVSSPQKIQPKKPKHFAFFAKTGWSLGMRLSSQLVVLWQSTGAAFSPTCRAFICSTDDYFTEIDEDGGGSRGAVWSTKENCWFSNIT